MAIRISDYIFDGTYTSTDGILARSGVCVVLGRSSGAQWAVVDVGESASVQERLITMTASLVGNGWHIGSWQWRCSTGRNTSGC
jgi:hypothetical protein